ncbi:dual specificity protein phosphatase 12 [Elysia marginata]|uniref:Dual specificity protein phosphatase 12 n=1 Tax=Elysia marginata TaxID=1093978 RepID=A0AAV4I951_9GAST|nr:dual specificity protein phosphatase 12 [Elysia marginata]
MLVSMTSNINVHKMVGVPESEIPAEVYVEPDYSVKGNAAFFKCRKCRQFLFHSGAVTSHNIGEGESAFDWRSKVPTNQRRRGDNQSTLYGDNGTPAVTKCTRSLFVDPLVWMKGKIHDIQGKLHCPKCSTKIGSYVWYGEKCPCGAWVAPAFHIDSGKVDKIPAQHVVPRSNNPATARIGPFSPGGITSTGRPLSYMRLPERASSAASGKTVATPVAAVQPMIASAASASGNTQVYRKPQGSSPSSSTSTPFGPLSSCAQVQRLGSQRATATIVPLQGMDLDDAGDGGGGDNMDLESGINSIHMDVDS